MSGIQKTITKKSQKKKYMLKMADNVSDSESETEDIMIKQEENRVYFHADVTRKNGFELMECLRKAQEYVALRNIKNEFEKMNKIYLYIFSDGGEVFVGMNIADFILNSKVDIVTINEGCVASAGTIISMAGKERYIRRNAYMLIHEIRSGVWGKYSECQDDMDNNNILMDNIKRFINERCNNPKLAKKLNKVLKHDHLWNAEKCLKYNLVDKIV